MPVLAWIVIAVLVVAVVGGVWAVRLERRSPSSYTRSPGGGLAWWGLLPAEEQEGVDNAALELGAQAEIDARQDAAEAAGFLAQHAQTNDLFRP